jgi:hypothetical protein
LTRRQASDKTACINPSPDTSIYPRPTYVSFNFGFKANTGVRLCSVMELQSYTWCQSSCPALCIRSDMRLSLALSPRIHCYSNSRGLSVHPWGRPIPLRPLPLMTVIGQSIFLSTIICTNTPTKPPSLTPEPRILTHVARICRCSLASAYQPIWSLSCGGAMRAVPPHVQNVKHNCSHAFHLPCPAQHRSLWRLLGYSPLRVSY